MLRESLGDLGFTETREGDVDVMWVLFLFDSNELMMGG